MFSKQQCDNIVNVLKCMEQILPNHIVLSGEKKIIHILYAFFYVLLLFCFFCFNLYIFVVII